MSGAAITGAAGFLGWHLRVLVHAWRLPSPTLVRTDDGPAKLAAALNGRDRVIHLAGVNRGTAEEVIAGNVAPAEALAQGLRQCATPPKTVVFANSVQAGNATPYGDAKAAAAQILAEATRWTGSTFVDLRLPNLFGEHGRPHYNSVVATFCAVLAGGGNPEIHNNPTLELLHATDAASLLLGAETEPDAAAQTCFRSVRELADRLRHFATVYARGELPELLNRFDVRLFNTYRSHLPAAHIPLPRHADARGELVETVKVHGGGGQTFCSSTVSGVTRGDHFHLAKVERFVVLRGHADIFLRRVLHEEVVRFRVSGDEPVAIDMPTMWAHNITNVGDGELLTLFWSNELFDAGRPDTYPEKVAA